MFHRARLRLAGWYAGAMLVVLAGVGAAAFGVLRHQLDSGIDGSLRNALNEVRDLPPPPAEGTRNGNQDDDDDDDHRDGDEHDRTPATLGTLPTDIFTVWLGQDGVVLANPRQIRLDGFPLAELAREEGDGRILDVTADGTHYRLSVAHGEAGSRAASVFVGRSLAARDSQLNALTWVLLSGGTAGLALAGAGGYFIAGRTLSPIRQALETQQRFVSDASHELRTPVAVVRANAEVLLRHPEQNIDENIDQVAAIADEAEHMSRLVADLLTLARADEQRLELQIEDFSLDETLASVIRDMAPVAAARGVEMESYLAPVVCEGDRQRVRQVAAILIDNAIKFTPAGGTVAIHCTRDGHRAEFRVVDNGPGIPPGDQQRIFERFYRADSARTGGSGTGLGLAIAQSLVTAHGGQISAHSTPGKGATFTVRLGSAHRA